MSAIGDYIHLHGANYNKYGTAHQNERPVSYDFMKQRQAIVQRAQASSKNMTAAEKLSLEQTLTGIMSNKDESSVEAGIRNEIEAILYKMFEESMGKINWETGNVTAIKNTATKSTAQLKADGNKFGVEVKSIQKRLEAIILARDALTDVTKKQELTQKINDIYVALNEAITGKKKGLIGILKTTQDHQYSHIRIDKENTLITEVNQLLKDYASAPAINLQKGTMAEYLIAMAPAVARVKAGESLSAVVEDLAKNVVGGDRSKVVIDFDKHGFLMDEIKITKEDLKRQDVKNWAVGDGTLVSYGTSQDKIDVKLEWNNRNYNVSAKNVNLKSGYGVHILSGSSLLYLIQDEDSAFVNNYFNVIADHRDGIAAKNAADGHSAMKLTLLYKALTGDTYGRSGSADLFIVNDNSTGEIKIIDPASIVNKFNQRMDGVTFKPLLETLKIKNARTDNSYGPRISKFIIDVHKQKMSVSLNPSMLA